MTRKLTQAEWADLSAWMDGELSTDRAAEIESLVASDDAWGEALADLRSLDDALAPASAPAPPANLEQRVLEFVRENTLTEDQLAQLSAWMDGELDEIDAARVARRVVTSSAWRRAHEELRQVDQALETYTAPHCPSDLPGRIVARTTGRAYDWAGLRKTLLSAPAAVAAMVAVLLAVYMLTSMFSKPSGINPTPNPGGAVVHNSDDDKTPADSSPSDDTETLVDKQLDGYDDVEQFAIMNREMIEHYEVIENLDVLSEMERLDTQGDS